MQLLLANRRGNGDDIVIAKSLCKYINTIYLCTRERIYFHWPCNIKKVLMAFPQEDNPRNQVGNSRLLTKLEDVIINFDKIWNVVKFLRKMLIPF